MDLQKTRAKLLALKISHEAAVKVHERAKTRWTAAEDEMSFASEAQVILQTASQITQQQAHDRISNVVSRCLSSVFDDPYEFRIEFERKRGKTEANLKFVKSDMVLNEPIKQAGGGAIDVASFALRLSCLILQRPVLRRVLILDEPFKNIRGKIYRRRVRALIEDLSKELGVQFILNVDSDAYPEFLLGKVVEIG